MVGCSIIGDQRPWSVCPRIDCVCMVHPFTSAAWCRYPDRWQGCDKSLQQLFDL